MCEGEHKDTLLTRAILDLAHAIRESNCKHGTETILHRIEQMESKIMALGDDLITAATTLSTAADALSVKTDTLVTAAEAVIAALKGASGLPPGAADALAAMNKSIAGAKSTGDKLDTEVANLDAVLPTPAPPAPTP